jgi:hypothetical protein
VDRGCPVDWGCQVIIRKTRPWTIVGNVFGECHAPCTFKTSFIDFVKEKVPCTRYKRQNVSSNTQLSILFWWLCWIISPTFLYIIFYIYYWTWNTACRTLSNKHQAIKSCSCCHNFCPFVFVSISSVFMFFFAKCSIFYWIPYIEVSYVYYLLYIEVSTVYGLVWSGIQG